MRYKEIKILDQKEHRATLLIEYHNQIAILKKILTDKQSVIERFATEREVLASINKPYVPKLYAHDDKHMIMEYFPSRLKDPQSFATHMTQEIQDRIVTQLIDLNTSPLSSIPQSSNQPLLSLYRLVAKSIKEASFQPVYIKTLTLCTLLYLKNIPLFRSKVATKGDFTEVNILVGAENSVKFIDFDNYHTQGSWVEDASYLLLHQDVKIEQLSWQLDFFRAYLLRVAQESIFLNRDYIRFWLLSSCLKQYAIRYQQYQKNKISKTDLQCKAEHLQYFLEQKNSDLFLIKMGF